MTWSQCSTCKKNIWHSDVLRHKCQPFFDVFIPEWHGGTDDMDPSTIDWDDGGELREHDAEEAAKTYAQQSNDEGTQYDGLIVFVKDRETGHIHRVSVSSEYSMDYSAKTTKITGAEGVVVEED